MRIDYPYSDIYGSDTIRFRINAQSSWKEIFLRNGETQEGSLEPHSALEGVFFQYMPMKVQDKITLTLTSLEGGDVQMYVSVGDSFPGPQSANLGQFYNSTEITLEKMIESNPACG